MIERNGYTDDRYFAAMNEEGTETETVLPEADAAGEVPAPTTGSTPEDPSSADKPLSFEAAMERLEQLVKRMESGKVSLDESLELFKEGSELAQFCRRKLSDNENKIKQLLESAEGFREEDFHV